MARARRKLTADLTQAEIRELAWALGRAHVATELANNAGKPVLDTEGRAELFELWAEINTDVRV